MPACMRWPSNRLHLMNRPAGSGTEAYMDIRRLKPKPDQPGFAPSSPAGRMRSLVMRFFSRFMTTKRLP